MPTVKDVYNAIDKMYPYNLSEIWDNNGILINSGGDVTGILVTLDITNDAVRCAKENDINLIVSHHPVIFDSIKSINFYEHEILINLLKNNINAISAHTNLDKAPGGLTSTLAKILGLSDTREFENGVGIIGSLTKEMPVDEFILKIKKDINTPFLRVVKGSKSIKKVAAVPGAGSYAAQALANGADAYVSGEIKHSDCVLAHSKGLCVIQAGHFETEIFALPLLVKAVKTVKDVKIHTFEKNIYSY